MKQTQRAKSSSTCIYVSTLQILASKKLESNRHGYPVGIYGAVFKWWLNIVMCSQW